MRRATPTTPPASAPLCVWAHPDDESYLAGGLLAALRAAGRRVVCVTATLGEAAARRPRRRAGRAGRRSPARELAAALRRARRRPSTTSSDLADGGCAEVDPATGAGRLAGVDEVRPDTVVTFGPDGFTGHPDHVAVGAWTGRALRGVPDGIRLLHPVATGATSASRDSTSCSASSRSASRGSAARRAGPAPGAVRRPAGAQARGAAGARSQTGARRARRVDRYRRLGGHGELRRRLNQGDAAAPLGHAIDAPVQE